METAVTSGPEAEEVAATPEMGMQKEVVDIIPPRRTREEISAAGAAYDICYRGE